MSLETSCALCDEARSGILSDFFLTTLAGLSMRRIVSSTSSVYVIPSLGGFGRFHLLICSRNHFASLRDCPPDLRGELSTEVSRLCCFLKDNFGGYTLIFENGSSVKSLGEARCIDHVHIHVVLLAEKIRFPEQSDSRWRTLGHLAKIDQGVVNPNNDYVAAGWATDTISVLQAADIQTQLMRRHLATHSGRPAEWNWRDFPHIEKVRATAEQLRRSSFPQRDLGVRNVPI